MFGLFRPRAEKVALKLERLLRAQERAYEKGMWDVFIYAGQQVEQMLRKIHLDTDLNEDQLEAFIKQRGLVRSMVDPTYREKMMDAQMRAGALYV